MSCYSSPGSAAPSFKACRFVVIIFAGFFRITALRIFKNNSYDSLLNWIGLHSILEGRRIQDMLITISSCFQEKAPTPIVNLLKVKDTKCNIRGTNMLSLPKVRSTKHGLRSFRYFVAKTWNALPDSIRAMAGTREF